MKVRSESMVIHVTYEGRKFPTRKLLNQNEIRFIKQCLSPYEKFMLYLLVNIIKKDDAVSLSSREVYLCKDGKDFWWEHQLSGFSQVTYKPKN